ncbi:MAG: hypothetical protein OQK12_17195, partial [Motiliproteus sp.]|nr:hypothetical protein [Motiliproteus sp.]
MHPIQSLLEALGTSANDARQLPLFDLLESACEGTVIVDGNCQIVWISEKYRALMGLPDDAKILGRDIQQVIPNSTMRQVVESGHAQLLDLMR